MMSSAKWFRSTPAQCFRTPCGRRARLSNEFERNVRNKNVGAVFSSAAEYQGACSGSDFERRVASMHARIAEEAPTMNSSAMCEQTKVNAVFSNAVEEKEACSSNDFERPMMAEHAKLEISCAIYEDAAPVKCSRSTSPARRSFWIRDLNRMFQSII